MDNIINLSGLLPGHRAKIGGFSTDELPAKFFELGLVPGAEVEVCHRAPFGGPICVRIVDNDALIAIRRSEAKWINVAKIL